jgi:ubiquinone/menaquinone biosynthesis C-methylase UbiE
MRAMERRLQRRIQRYGWDLAAPDYEALWQAQLVRAQERMLEGVAIARGERVLDVACGTGLVTLRAAEAVGPGGYVVGTDISGEMTDTARIRAHQRRLTNTMFYRMEAERLTLPDAEFDVALCALGLMYVTDPVDTVRELRRVVRPHGRIGLAVWGERSRCGWAVVFPITAAEVSSDVCPLFFSLGQQGALARVCEEAGLADVRTHRIDTTLDYSNAREASDAAFVGGPVALAWSRFDETTRLRVRERYIDAISPWRDGEKFRVPGEFVVVTARVPPEA